MRSQFKQPDRNVGRSAGFTLLEMLIALALFALILVLILGGLRSAKLALQRVGISNEAENVDAAQILLRNLLTEIRAIPLFANTNADADVIEGEQHQLTFISSYSAQGQVGGLYVSTLESQKSQRDSLNIILRQKLFRPPQSNGSVQRIPERTTILIKSAAGLQFRYYGTTRIGQPAAWYSTWQTASALPELIEVTVIFPQGDARFWRPVVVPLVFAR